MDAIGLCFYLITLGALSFLNKGIASYLQSKFVYSRFASNQVILLEKSKRAPIRTYNQIRRSTDKLFVKNGNHYYLISNDMVPNVLEKWDKGILKCVRLSSNKLIIDNVKSIFPFELLIGLLSAMLSTIVPRIEGLIIIALIMFLYMNYLNVRCYFIVANLSKTGKQTDVDNYRANFPPCDSKRGFYDLSTKIFYTKNYPYDFDFIKNALDIVDESKMNNINTKLAEEIKILKFDIPYSEIIFQGKFGRIILNNNESIAEAKREFFEIFDNYYSSFKFKYMHGSGTDRLIEKFYTHLGYVINGEDFYFYDFDLKNFLHEYESFIKYEEYDYDMILDEQDLKDIYSEIVKASFKRVQCYYESTDGKLKFKYDNREETLKKMLILIDWECINVDYFNNNCCHYIKDLDLADMSKDFYITSNDHPILVGYMKNDIENWVDKVSINLNYKLKSQMIIRFCSCIVLKFYLQIYDDNEVLKIVDDILCEKNCYFSSKSVNIKGNKKFKCFLKSMKDFCLDHGLRLFNMPNDSNLAVSEMFNRAKREMLEYVERFSSSEEIAKVEDNKSNTCLSIKKQSIDYQYTKFNLDMTNRVRKLKEKKGVKTKDIDAICSTHNNMSLMIEKNKIIVKLNRDVLRFLTVETPTIHGSIMRIRITDPQDVNNNKDKNKNKNKDEVSKWQALNLMENHIILYCGMTGIKNLYSVKNLGNPIDPEIIPKITNLFNLGGLVNRDFKSKYKILMTNKFFSKRSVRKTEVFIKKFLKILPLHCEFMKMLSTGKYGIAPNFVSNDKFPQLMEELRNLELELHGEISTKKKSYVNIVERIYSVNYKRLLGNAELYHNIKCEESLIAKKPG